MKKVPGLAILCCSLFLHQVNAREFYSRQDMSNTEAEAGNVHFHGRVFVSPCVLDMSTRDQSVELGDISAARFHQRGDRSTPVKFTVRLNDCLKGATETIENFPAEMSGRYLRVRGTGEQGVTIRFSAEGDSANADLVKLRGSVHGAGLRIMNGNQALLGLNRDQKLYLINPGNNTLTFLAALESTQQSVSAGEFQGLVRLEVEYL